jgi:hypothetical protein
MTGVHLIPYVCRTIPPTVVIERFPESGITWYIFVASIKCTQLINNVDQSIHGEMNFGGIFGCWTRESEACT